jgi:pyrroline-5-carboxylate reductase
MAAAPASPDSPCSPYSKVAKLGFIGVGNMGSAILRGLSRRGDLELWGYDAYPAKAGELARDIGLKLAGSARELAQACDYVVLGVKPQQVEAVLADLRPVLAPDTCLLSIAAGVTQASLGEYSGGVCPVVRIMPNTPAMVGAGVYALCFEDSRLTQAQQDMIRSLFESIGTVHVLAEKMFDAFTAICGCGPAYVFYFMDSLVEAGVQVGLSRDQATGMVKALFEGSVKLAQESPLHLAQLREMVTSPAGSTIVATTHFDRQAVRGTIIDAVIAAKARNTELGKK